MDYDTPWKDMLDEHLRLALAFFFPEAEGDIDWSVDPESLEQELRKLSPAAEVGKRLADKLVKVRSKGGDDHYLHAEVQGQVQEGFERRVYVYAYRIDDHFGLPADSLVILADDDPDWRPTTYQVRLPYTTLTFSFQRAKVLDWRGREPELREHPNPVALFVLAHLESRRTQDDPEERSVVKVGLIVNLLGRTLEVEERRRWYRYFDWLLPLPRPLEEQVLQQVAQHEKELRVPFVTFAERYGQEKALLRGLEVALKLKFGAEGLALLEALGQVKDAARLDALLQDLPEATSLDDFRQRILAVSTADKDAPSTGPSGNGSAP